MPGYEHLPHPVTGFRRWTEASLILYGRQCPRYVSHPSESTTEDPARYSEIFLSLVFSLILYEGNSCQNCFQRAQFLKAVFGKPYERLEKLSKRSIGRVDQRLCTASLWRSTVPEARDLPDHYSSSELHSSLQCIQTKM